MARRAKREVKIEPPSETLGDVLSPSYSIQLVSDSAAEDVQVVNSFKTKCFFSFTPRYSSDYSVADLVIHLLLPDNRKLDLMHYILRDLTESFKLGVKIDAYVQIKNSTDVYAFDLDVNRMKLMSNMMKEDFLELKRLIKSHGYWINTPLTVEKVLTSIHANGIEKYIEVDVSMAS